MHENIYYPGQHHVDGDYCRLVDSKTRQRRQSLALAPQDEHSGYQPGDRDCRLFQPAFIGIDLDDLQINAPDHRTATIGGLIFFEKPTLNPTPQESWGFLHPECFGDKALLFFSWDLAKTIEQQFRLHADSSLGIQLSEAQKAVDRLLNQYVQIQANPAAFEGQSIVLQLEHDDNDADSTPVLALKTSAELEERILAAQAQMQTSHSVN